MNNIIENEIWKPIIGFEGLYEVSNSGKIKSLERFDTKKRPIKERILKTRANYQGYEYLGLCKNGIKKSYTVHRIVLRAFVTNLQNLPTINHKNGIKSDNRVENLEWLSVKDNINHALNTGLRKRGEFIGLKNSQAKLTELEVFQIRALAEEGNLRQWQIAKKFNISQGHVSDILNKKRRTYIL